MHALSYLKYPLWTLWQFVVAPYQSLRNTRAVLEAFWLTAIIGRRAILVLKRHSFECTASWFPPRWKHSTRGRYIWRIGHLWARAILARTGLRWSVMGYERVDWSRAHIVVANHQSTLDALLVLALVKDGLGRYVCKKEALHFPYVGAAIRLGAQIVIDRKNHKQAMRAIREGMSLWSHCDLVFFPEGTRSRSGALNEFRRGAFAIAIETGLPILPVAISGTFEALPKGSLLRLSRQAAVSVEFGKTLEVRGLTSADVPLLADKTRDRIAQMLRTKQSA